MPYGVPYLIIILSQFTFYNVRLINIIKPGLFIYECIRMIILVASVVYLMPGSSIFSWLFFAAPSAMFLLMALFLWLDAFRYKAYLPLFMAGKCIGIFAQMGWSIITRRDAVMERFNIIIDNVNMILLSGDLFAMAAILMIIKSIQNSSETPLTAAKEIAEDKNSEPDGG